MSTPTTSRKKSTKAKRPTTQTLSLPKTTTTIELGGTAYIVTPKADMEEWLEDMGDIFDSVQAMCEPGDGIPFADVMKSLGIKLPARRKK